MVDNHKHNPNTFSDVKQSFLYPISETEPNCIPISNGDYKNDYDKEQDKLEGNNSKI